MSKPTVWRWWDRFLAEGVDGLLYDATRPPGRTPVAEDKVKAVLGAVSGALARGEAVQLAGFGAFAAKDRSAREGRNPRTSESVAVPASRSVLFRAGKGLRDAVNRARE